MKKIAILNSYTKNRLIGVNKRDLVRNFLAGPDNVGNLVYLEFLGRRFKNYEFVSTEEIIAEPTRCRDEYATIILPLSNMLSPYFESPLVDVLIDYDINVILFSIGIQLPLGMKSSDITLSQDALRLLSLADNHNTLIGVRGNISKQVIGKLGLKSMIIGCPSLLEVKNQTLYLQNFCFEKICGNCTLNGLHKTLTSDLIYYIVKNCSGYVLQDEVKIIRDIFDINLDEIPFASKNTPYYQDLQNKLFDYGYYNNGILPWGEVRDFFRKKSFISFELREWSDYLKNFTLSVGTRFHGNVMAMYSGMPAIFVPCDLRTKELIEFHKVPSVSDIKMLENITEKEIREMILLFHESFNNSWNATYKFFDNTILCDYVI